MSKRPLDSDDKPVNAKKTRVSTPLDNIKAKMDQIFKQAAEHHEEARISAVDSAYELEEMWKEAEEKKNATEVELKALAVRQKTAENYLETFESNPSIKMLEKASKSDIQGLDKLTQDRKELIETLQWLRDVLESTSSDFEKCTQKLKTEQQVCKDLSTRHSTAETKAELIANFTAD